MKMSKRKFGSIKGKEITEYTLENSQGSQLSAISYGATLTALRVPDKNGKIENVVLGLDSIEEYERHTSFYGATIGRVAGRIKEGKFTLNGQNYQVDTNEGKNQLHGGGDFNTKIWDVKENLEDNQASLTFSLLSPAGNYGYPGNLSVEVTFTLTEKNEWKINYTAVSDEATLFNPTTHTFFNLTGDKNKSILDHHLVLSSDKIVELGEGYIPTGHLLSVENTAFDFRKGGHLKQGLESIHPQNQLAGGFDHAFVYNREIGEPDLTLSEPVSGRILKVFSDQDSVVIYTGNRLSEQAELVGYPVKDYTGLTLETQQLPDAINNEGFGSIILEANQTFRSETIYQFDTI